MQQLTAEELFWIVPQLAEPIVDYLALFGSFFVSFQNRPEMGHIIIVHMRSTTLNFDP